MSKNNQKMPPMVGKKPKRGAKNGAKTLLRLLSYLRPYTFRIIIVLLCIGVSAVASLYAADFMKQLIFEIGVLVDAVKAGQESSTLDYSPIIMEIVKMIVIYVLGIISSADKRVPVTPT